MNHIEEQQLVTRFLGRKFYLSYCEAKHEQPWSPPYVPKWAKAYAAQAVELLGWDEETIKQIRTEKSNAHGTTDTHAGEENRSRQLA